MRRGGSLYVMTDPTKVLPIGIAGRGTSIGLLGDLFYTGNGPLTPTSGSTVTLGASTLGMLNSIGITGPVTLGALTIAFNNGWIDQQAIVITFGVAITAITWSGTNRSGSFPASAAVGDGLKVVRVAATSKWTLYT